MPVITLKCPHCKSAVNKTMVFDSKGHAPRGSGICPKCHKRIMWWGENNRGKIVKD